MEALLIIGYVLLAALIVFLSIKLSDYVDMLDKSTKLSGALLGGILLAAVTSLPELFTSLTAVVGVGNTHYVMGNILGSNIFDIIVLAALVILFIKNFQSERIAKCQIWQFISLILLYGVTCLALYLPVEIRKYIVLGGWFNIFSVLILGIYLFSIFKLDKTEEKEESTEKVTLTVKQLSFRFVLAALLLIGASIGVTYLSDMIVQKYHIDATLAGSLLLGVMTSLPEVISTFNLFMKKNINAGTGNIVGSAVFNYLIIFLSELFSFKETVFTPNPEANKLLIFNIVSVVTLLGAVLIKMGTAKLADKKRVRLVAGSAEIALAAASIAGYVLYLVLPGQWFIF